MFTLSNVTKNYPKGRRTVAALRGVNLVIDDGEWLTVQGRTGHGKSTLLQLLGGLDRPSSGTLTFAGHDLTQLREAQVTRLRARDEIIALLDRLWRELGLTLVLVTHDSAVARRAQRVAIMNKGRLSIRQDTRRAIN